MKIHIVRYLKDNTIESAFTDLDDLIDTYGNLGYIMRNYELYETAPQLGKPVYEILTVELKGKIKYEGKVEL